ncbi:MAG: RdgB/HAM1 family non-canonical purine NTP pyrophosphatase [Candidatus Omnitrophica bacterium]|nr:RdgB/HAM1 family non-canonical purine NTP pyrophosphatase [Candidatus Omnitrophota bacterium]
MREILIATRNKNKFIEIKKMLEPLGLKLKSLNDFKNIPEIEEDGETFVENARKKAIEASLGAGLISLADDSGLEVEALGGRPGVYSARFSGPEANDEKNIEKLIGLLKNTPENKLKACFRCLAVLADKNKIIAETEGVCRGRIILSPRGSHGFGYDPVFIPDGYDKTFAELGSEIKDKISHRAKAFGEMSEVIFKSL